MESHVSRASGTHTRRALPTLMVDGMVRSHSLTDAVASVEQLLGSGSFQHARNLRTPSKNEQAATAASSQSAIATSEYERASPAGPDAITSQHGFRKSASTQRAPIRPSRMARSSTSSSSRWVDENRRDFDKESLTLYEQKETRSMSAAQREGTSRRFLGLRRSSLPPPPSHSGTRREASAPPIRTCRTPRSSAPAAR